MDLERNPNRLNRDRIKMNTNVIKDFFKSGDVIAFFVLAVVVVVLVAVFGVVEYTPVTPESQMIANLVNGSQLVKDIASIF